MKAIKVSDLRQNLQDVIDTVYYTGKPFVVIRRNKPRVVITPLPENDRKITEAIKEYEKTTKKIVE